MIGKQGEARMMCPWCKQEFTNRSYSELCPKCDCGFKPDETKWSYHEIMKFTLGDQE